MTTSTTALRFQQILTLVAAWDDDDRREKGYKDKDKPSEVGPVLVSMLDALVSTIVAEGAQWDSGTRELMRSTYLTHLNEESRNTTWRTRNALTRLEEHHAKGKARGFYKQTLQLALIEAGCWDELPARGTSPVKEEGKFSAYGAFMKAVNEASQNNRVDVLERLMDWEGSAERCVPLLQSVGTGRGISGPLNNGVSGWAWTVRNVSQECLALWLKLGADPNAMDAKGRPVLAYAATDATVKQLLDAGADPLGLHVPLKQRSQHLQTLWEGWNMALHNHLRYTDSPHNLFGAAATYLSTRLATWSQAEVQQSLNDVLYERYFQQLLTTISGRDDEPLTAYVRSLARVKDDSFLRRDVAGMSLSFAGATAHALLTGTNVSAEAKIKPGAWKDLTPQARTIEVAPNVLERDLTALLDFHQNPNQGKELFQAVPAERVADVFGLLYAHAHQNNSDEPLSDTSRLDPAFVALLAKRHMEGAPHLQTQVPRFMDAYLNQLWKRPMPGAYFLGPVVVWMDRYGQRLPLKQKARWCALALSGLEDMKESTQKLALDTLAQALMEGWKAFDDGSDPVLTQALGQVRSTYPVVESLFKSKTLERAWQDSASGKKPKAPRF